VFASVVPTARTRWCRATPTCAQVASPANLTRLSDVDAIMLRVPVVFLWRH
jgi:hypothetical protein